MREDALATASEHAQLPWLAAWFDGVLQALEAEEHGNDWAEVRRALPPARPGIEPWTRGHTLAHATRERVGANGGRFDFSPSGPLTIPHQPSQPPSTRIHGLVAAKTPACVTVPRGQTGTRFLIARALGEFLGRSTPGTTIDY